MLDDLYETMRHQRGDKGDEYIGIMKDALKGKFTQGAILQKIRADQRQLAMKVMSLWGNGDLFPSQRMDFTSWLSVGPEEYEKELFRANESLATFELMGEQPDHFRKYVERRIWTPGIGRRKAILDAGQNDGLYKETLDHWSGDNTKYGWRWVS
jgi:hypothetical protein